MPLARFAFLLPLGLGLLLSSATLPTPPASRYQLTMRLNGGAIVTDSIGSRITASSGAGKVLTLSIVRADFPDDVGLSILVDEFKPQPGVYRFKEILSGHVREAYYRADDVTAESKACGVNDGEVRITAVDTKAHTLTGTYRAVLCQTNSSRAKAKRLTLEGNFHFPYEVR
ncbi:hypothetical protein [Solirubrum puertoriconensis]|uniref:Uncharacterized protein n=1 Tax=Solirubrum puertoriconensis TaxID=1751427 RepID=A0A9X0HNS1_SOLP1|nr:hypothetical protein [Solirubrum puertoriconensis]KUG09376.1 hypothetical protein ASU33_16735 [Solirubrum puertoriconensis]